MEKINIEDLLPERNMALKDSLLFKLELELARFLWDKNEKKQRFFRNWKIKKRDQRNIDLRKRQDLLYELWHLDTSRFSKAFFPFVKHWLIKDPQLFKDFILRTIACREEYPYNDPYTNNDPYPYWVPCESMRCIDLVWDVIIREADNEKEKKGLQLQVINLIVLSGCWTRACIALEPLPEDLIEFLSLDSIDDVREVVASRSTLPKKILMKLSEDKSSSVRAAIAQRHDLEKKLVEKLARDKSAFVRRTILERDGLSRNLILIFLKDPDYVNQQILSRLFY